MAGTWVRTADGQLVNLDLCSRVHVEDRAGEEVLVAFEPVRNGTYELARFQRGEEARSALDALAQRIGALPAG